jgi:hypothetical protein
MSFLARVRSQRAALARRALITLVFNTLVALTLWRADAGSRFLVQWIYSQAIGLSIWAGIDIGRLAFADAGRGFPPGWRTPALVIAGIVVGLWVGSAVGDWFSGQSVPLWARAPHGVLGVAALSTLAGVGFSYYYHARGTLAWQEAQLQGALRSAAEARLRLLESQLEPHMLFNTLANLRALMAADPPRAQAMLDRLITFLRATLSASQAPTHPLREEFARLADYLALMDMRMGDRLQVRMNLPGELAERHVPTLLLQPLVENAIRHGLEPSPGGGWIEIDACEDNDSLVLSVRNSGEPMADLARPGGFGLAQVRERLATLYGPQGRVDLSPAADARGGTLALVILPAHPTTLH